MPAPHPFGKVCGMDLRLLARAAVLVGLVAALATSALALGTPEHAGQPLGFGATAVGRPMPR